MTQGFKRVMPVISAIILGCLLPLFAFAQSSFLTLGNTKANNQEQLITLYAQPGQGTITFTLSPEPLNADRTHYPIIFIEWYNGTEWVQQMINLAYDMTFTLKVQAVDYERETSRSGYYMYGLEKFKINGAGRVIIRGENGVWSLKANGQKLFDAELGKATALRAIDFNDNFLGTTYELQDYALAGPGWHIPYKVADKNVFRLDEYSLSNLQFLSLDRNQFTQLSLTTLPNLKVFEASGNRFKNSNFGFQGKLAALDLSLNFLNSISIPAWEDGTTTPGTTIPATFQSTHSRQAVEADSLTMHDDVTYQSRYLDLSHNNFPIGNLPAKPQNLPDEHYLVAYQKRFALAASSFDIKDPILISAENSSFQGISDSRKPGTVKIFQEKNSVTDEYVEIPSSNYTLSQRGDGSYLVQFNGHPTKDDLGANFFATVTPAAGTMPQQVSPIAKKRSTSLWPSAPNTAYAFQSFERNIDGTDPTNNLLNQPQGTQTTLQPSQFDDGSVLGNLSTGDGLNSRKIEERFYRSNNFELDVYRSNYWYGGVSNEWNDPKNWTNEIVPPTTKAEWEAIANTKPDWGNVTFATANNNDGKPAVRDLELDQDRYIYRYINTSERGKAISIPAGLTLHQKDWKPEVRTDVPIFRIRAAKDKPNGSYILNWPWRQYLEIKAEVELYAKGDNANTHLSQTKWQYFGLPLRDVTYASASLGDPNNATVSLRKYSRELQGQYDNKWVAMDKGKLSVLEPWNDALQISQAQPATYRFQGKLYMDQASFAYDGSTSPTNYDNMNLFANPYVAAMQIDKLDFRSANVDKVVYLFNTGSREQWLSGNGGTTPGELPGSYVAAIPTGLSGYLSTMPKTIPSLSTFMLKASGSGIIDYYYDHLVPNIEVNRARLAPEAEPNITSLTIDLLHLKDSVTYDRLWLVTAEGTSKDYDNGYDAEKFVSGNMAQLYAMGEKNYQVLATDDIHGTRLALTSGPVERQLSLRFHIERPEFNANTYYIDDHLTGTTTVVSDGDTYTFTAKPTDPLHRFTVRTNNTTAIAKTQATIEIVATGNRRIEVRNHTATEATAKVYDVKGILLDTITIAPGEKVSTDVDMPGLYLVQATNGTERADARLLLK